MITMVWQKTFKGSLFVIKEGDDSWTGYKKIKISLNQNICIDDVLGEINVFMNFESPGIEHSKILILEGVDYINSRIQMCVKAAKVGSTFIV